MKFWILGIVIVLGIVAIALFFLLRKKKYGCVAGQCVECSTSNCTFTDSNCSNQCGNPSTMNYGCYNGQCVHCDPSHGVPCSYDNPSCIPVGGTGSDCTPGVLGWKCNGDSFTCTNDCFMGEPSCLATQAECQAACQPEPMYSCNSTTGCCTLCPDPSKCTNTHPSLQDCLNNCSATSSFWQPNSDNTECIQCTNSQMCDGPFPPQCTDYATCLQKIASPPNGFYCSNGNCIACSTDPKNPLYNAACVAENQQACEANCCTNQGKTMWKIITDSEGNRACEQCQPNEVCETGTPCVYTSELECRTYLPPSPWDGWFCSNGYCSQCLSWDPSTYPPGTTCTIGGIDDCRKTCAGGYKCDPLLGPSPCSADDPYCLFATEADAAKVCPTPNGFNCEPSSGSCLPCFGSNCLYTGTTPAQAYQNCITGGVCSATPDQVCNLTIYDSGLTGYVLDNNGTISFGPSTTPTSWIVNEQKGTICSPTSIGMCWNKPAYPGMAYTLGKYDPKASTNLSITGDDLILEKDTSSCLGSSLATNIGCQTFTLGGNTCVLNDPVLFYCDPVKGPTVCPSSSTHEFLEEPVCQPQQNVRATCVDGFSSSAGYYVIYGYSNPSFTGTPQYLSAGDYGLLSFVTDETQASIFYYDGKNLAVASPGTIPGPNDPSWLNVVNWSGSCGSSTPMVIMWGTANKTGFTIQGNTLTVTGGSIVNGLQGNSSVTLGVYCYPASSYPLYIQIGNYCVSNWCTVGSPNCYQTASSCFA